MFHYNVTSLSIQEICLDKVHLLYSLGGYNNNTKFLLSLLLLKLLLCQKKEQYLAGMITTKFSLKAATFDSKQGHP